MEIRIYEKTIDITTVDDIIHFCKNNKCPPAWEDMIFDMQKFNCEYTILEFLEELLRE